MPAIGLPGRPARRVDDVVGADDDGHVGVREVLVDLVHLHHDVVGHLGLGQQHVHVAGHAAGHRVDGKAHVTPFSRRVLVISLTVCWACATAMP
jgi:hypothetical protein